MKLFATSDIHGDYNSLEQIIRFINGRKDIDALIVCGDIFRDKNYNTPRDLADKQYDDYIEFKCYLDNLKCKKAYFILGNHDVAYIDSSDLSYLPNLIKYDDKLPFVPFEMVNVNFYGTKREGNERDIEAELEKLNINPSKIIVAHVPPFGCQDKSEIGHRYGSKAVREMILNEKPAIYICGHIHEDFGVCKLGQTFVFNCTCLEGIARGWIIDTITREYEEIYVY